MAQFLRPTSTITAGAWTAVGAADLHSAINSVTQDDSTYINAAAATEAAFGLSAATDPLISTGHVLRYALRRDGTNRDITIVVTLQQNGTAIAQWTHANPTAAFTLFEQTLTGAQADAITDYGALRLSVNATVVNAPRSAQFSWAELEIPDAAAVTHLLEAAPAGSGDLSATIRAAFPLATDITGSGDTTSSLTRTSPLAAAPAGTGDPSASLLAALRLAAAADGSGDVTAAIDRVTIQNDTVDVYAQVFASDGATALTNRVLVASNASITSAYQTLDAAFTITGEPTRSDWDGARLRLEWEYTTHDAATLVRVTSVDLGGWYLVGEIDTITHNIAAAITGEGDITITTTRTAPLTADATGEGDVSGALLAVLRFTAATSGEGDVSATITRAASLAADATGSADLTSAILATLRLTADSAGEGDVSGALLAVLRFTAATSGEGDVSATITRAASLTADATGSADLTSAILATLRLTAATSGEGDTTSALTRTAPLSVAIAGVGDVAADTAGAVGVDATIVGTADVTAAILATLRLMAAADGAGDVTVSVAGAADLEADATGAGDITATATRTALLQAAVTGSADLTSAILATLRLTADSAGEGDLATGISAARLLAGDATGSGDLTSAILATLRVMADSGGEGDVAANVLAVTGLAAAPEGAGDVSAFFEQFANTILTPTSSSSAVNIVNQAGLTTNLHAAINESMSSPDEDATYLVNTMPATGSVRLGLAGIPGTFQSMRTINVRVRARREA